MASPKVLVYTDGLEFMDHHGNKKRFEPLDGGGYQTKDVPSGTVIQTVANYRKHRKIKRDVNGAVVFAGAGTSRGTNTSLTGQTTNTNLSTNIQATANFCKAIGKLVTTGTVTTGSAILKIIQGGATLTSIATNTPTGTVTLTATASNTIMTAPKALLSNNVGGGTLATITVTEQLEDLVTNQTPLL